MPGGTGTTPYLAVKGVRDIASGLIGLALLLAGTPQVLGWFALTVAVIPLGDAAIVLRHHGPKTAAYGWHGGTAMALLVVAAIFLLG